MWISWSIPSWKGVWSKVYVYLRLLEDFYSCGLLPLIQSLRHEVLVVNFQSNVSSQATAISFDGSFIASGPSRSHKEVVEVDVVGIDVIACHAKVQ